MKTKITAFIIFSFIYGWNVKAQTQLWGTCYFGGHTGQGTIFTCDANGSNFH
jgi:uncharacterized repeat protein (TIGR03803 family)